MVAVAILVWTVPALRSVCPSVIVGLNTVARVNDLSCSTNVPSGMSINGNGQLLVVDETTDQLFRIALEISASYDILL